MIFTYFDSSSRELILDTAKSQLSNMAGQTHINHQDCPAGSDTKKRLYITVTDDNTMVLAFCHHCSQRGAYRLSNLKGWPPKVGNENLAVVLSGGEDRPNALEEQESAEKYLWEKRVKHYWEDATPMWDMYKDNLTVFNGMNRLLYPLRYFSDKDLRTLADKNFYHMRATDQFVTIPRLGEEGLVGLDIRFPTASESSIKWKRILKGDSVTTTPGRMVIYNSQQRSNAVICEDLISAMKIDMSGYAAVAITGSTLSTDDCLKLSMLYDTVVVWLDNDSDYIASQATAICAKLNVFMEKVHIIRKPFKDPKHYSCDAIQEIIHNFS